MTFGEYAAYYDLFYRDKDYAGETRYVSRILSAFGLGSGRILEFGCGTGQYTRSFLDLGYRMTGVDRSQAMLDRAAERCVDGMSAGTAEFALGDLRRYRSPARFDAVAALFHVISYQAENVDLLAGFQTARAHLAPGGLFVFDCWYGPGVLSDPPRNPVKSVENDRVAATRRTTAQLLPNANKVRVRFDLDLIDKHNGCRLPALVEEHVMRYLFTPEVADLAERAEMEVMAVYRWLTRHEPSVDTWYAFFVLQAI